MKAEDAIKADWLADYEKERDVLWQQLITFNICLFTLERIETFPFKVFLPLYDDRIFWQTTRNALVETIIMIAWRIVIDTDGDTLTLRALKNNIFTHIQDESAKSYLAEKVRKVEFEKRIEELGEKIRVIRHKSVAHFNREFHVNPNPREMGDIVVNLGDLKAVFEAAHDLFDVLCFDIQFYLWLWGYFDQAREKRQTDIDKLLADVARNSRILNLPETDPEGWKQGLYQLSPDEHRIINEYRRKFHLPEI